MPTTPEPSWRRASAAIASRARSRIAPSSPLCSAGAICARSSSRSSSESSSSAAELVLADALALRPRPRPRGRRSARTRARTRAGPPGTWRASPRAPRGSPRCAASRSRRARRTRRAARRCRSRRLRRAAPRRARGPGRQPRSGLSDIGGERSFSPTRSATSSMSVRCLTITDIVSLKVAASMSCAPSSSSARAQSIDSAIDGGFLRSSSRTMPMTSTSLRATVSRQLGRVQAHDLELVLERRVVEPQVQAAPLERLGQLARVVRGQQHDRLRARVDAAELGDRDLEVRQQLEQHRLELLVGLVDLVDQQHDRLLGGDRRQQRPREQELLAEDVVLDRLPAGAVGLGLDAQQLLAVVPLVQRLGLVEALVALQPHELAAEVRGERLGELGLADAGGPLDEHRLAELGREVGDQRGRLARQVADLAQPVGELFDGGGRRGLLS